MTVSGNPSHLHHWEPTLVAVPYLFTQGDYSLTVTCNSRNLNPVQVVDNETNRQKSTKDPIETNGADFFGSQTQIKVRGCCQGT
uniref:Uncharacterized protein n=1 Tax=Nelumbo nucifera TaxID=4432 RepID=A0A823A3J4_NELNU|nr:TPA_asm: hypothetical protein HUJ06_018555 [Nelumbo nucifera]